MKEKPKISKINEEPEIKTLKKQQRKSKKMRCKTPLKKQKPPANYPQLKVQKISKKQQNKK